MNDCANVGGVFNPLAEKDSMGRPNPYQDPSRGTIPDITMNSDGNFGPAVSKDLLINLAGKDSVIGRSITATLEGGVVLGC